VAKAPPDIRSLARKHTEKAIDRLAFWMMSDNAKASVSASAVLLDRGWGKATQTIAGDSENPLQVIERVIVKAKHSDG
jgi:hypothetical protein